MTAKRRAPEAVTTRAPAEAPRGDATSRRRLRGRVYIAASIALLAWIMVLLNVVSFRHYDRWDWTSEDVFTLSDRTRAVLGELDREIDAYLVLSTGEPSYQDLRELLLRYRAESERVTVHFVDPDRDPADYRVLAERFQLGSVDLGDGALGSDVAVVLSAGDRTWKVDRADLVQVDFDATGDGSDGVVLDQRSEQALTGGILEVTAGRRSKVCVTQGHGEWTVGRGVERDLAGLEDHMRRDNLDLETFETRGAARVPEGCDAVFVVAPTTAFMAEEAELLRDYVRGGGNLFVSVDPTLRREQIAPTGLEETLRDFGIRIDRALLLELDPAHLPQGTTSPIGPFVATSWGEHRVTRAFQGTPAPLMVESVQPVRPIDPARVTTLFSTSAESYGESDIAQLVAGESDPTRTDEDVAGPVSIAVATRIEQLGEPEEGDESAEGAEGQREGGRVIVVGDADFLRSSWLNDPRTVNYDIAVAIVGWLTEREALIELPGRRVADRSFQITADDALGLAFRVIVIFPAAFFFLGFAVWWNRRS